MLKKRHLVLTAIATALAVWFLASFYYLKLGAFVYTDPIAKAKKLITDYYVNTMTEEQLDLMNDAAIDAMVSSLKDPYSFYMDVEKMEAFNEEKAEEYKGIGVQVNFNMDTDTMTVISPYDGSPAQKAGILPGDIIKKVGNITVTAETYDAVLSYIRDGEEDNIVMVLQRDNAEKTVTVQREIVQEHVVTHKMLQGNLGYIRIGEFINSTTADFAKAVASLQAENMQALIIDLRNNPGGYANSVVAIADSLLPKGVIAYLEDSQGRREYMNSDAKCLSVPMAILINGGSASASELLAGTLKSHGLAVVIGEKSYGKAVGQSVYPLSDTTALYLTNARYFTPNGECIDGVGITPDIEIPLPDELAGKILLLSPEEDPQLSKAIEVLQEQLAE